MVYEKRSLIGIIRSRQRNWLGHIMRGDSLLRTILAGRMEGEKKKTKTENDVTGLDDERGLLQVEGERVDIVVNGNIGRIRTCPRRQRTKKKHIANIA